MLLTFMHSIKNSSMHMVFAYDWSISLVSLQPLIYHFRNRNAKRELTLSNVLFLYLYETNQQQYEREVAWICNRHCAFRLAGRDGFRRRTAILGANGKKVGVLVAVRRRRRARVESPHLTRVVPRQEMFQGVPAPAYSDHHVSPLQKLPTSRIFVISN